MPPDLLRMMRQVRALHLTADAFHVISTLEGLGMDADTVRDLENKTIAAPNRLFVGRRSAGNSFARALAGLFTPAVRQAQAGGEEASYERPE